MADEPIDSTEPELRTMRLSVAKFWDRYTESALLTLERDPPTGYTGTCRVDENDTPVMFLGEEKQFSIKRKDLLKFNYSDELMFSLGVYQELAEALTAVISLPRMAEETIPNRDQLNLVMRLLEQTPPPPKTPYSSRRQQVLSALEDSKIPMDRAAAMMEDLKPGAEAHEAYRLTGMVAMLCAEREILLKTYAFCFTDPEITKQIMAVIDNEEFEDAITVQTAIWALGRHNDKTSVDYLIRLLAKDDFDYHVIVVQEALQFLCSGRELIPKTDEKERSYWKDHQGRLPANPSGWAWHDAESVFWEKRLRCATEWTVKQQHGDRLETLKKDEVPPVRLTAGGPEELEA